MVAVGLYFGKEARDSFHTGNPIPMPHAPAMQSWEAAGMPGLVILFGLITMAAGLGWIKPKDQH